MWLDRQHTDTHTFFFFDRLSYWSRICSHFGLNMLLRRFRRMGACTGRVGDAAWVQTRLRLVLPPPSSGCAAGAGRPRLSLSLSHRGSKAHVKKSRFRLKMGLNICSLKEVEIPAQACGWFPEGYLHDFEIGFRTLRWDLFPWAFNDAPWGFNGSYLRQVKFLRTKGSSRVSRPGDS